MLASTSYRIHIIPQICRPRVDCFFGFEFVHSLHWFHPPENSQRCLPCILTALLVSRCFSKCLTVWVKSNFVPTAISFAHNESFIPNTTQSANNVFGFVASSLVSFPDIVYFISIRSLFRISHLTPRFDEFNLYLTKAFLNVLYSVYKLRVIKSYRNTIFIFLSNNQA